MSLSNILVPRILTEIYGPQGMRKRKLRVEGNQVIVRSSKKGRGLPDYRASFDESSIILYKKGIWPFKLLRQKVMLIDGADKCISLHYGFDAQGSPQARLDLPLYDRSAMERLAEATVIKNAGNVSAKMQIPGSFFMVSLLGLALSLITLLVVSGRLKI
jgi:hypothetical protein